MDAGEVLLILCKLDMKNYLTRLDCFYVTDILSQPSPVQFKTGATRYSVGTPHPHKLSNAKEGLYWVTHPCPWLNNSAEIVHSPSVKERKMSKI